ncbi:MAG: class I SAM-dependent methyltransferase [Alphaproteobacteria bacterium]|nr:class I SAM-dependent methyltransferase [Alphaproteobacteria bacterium]
MSDNNTRDRLVRTQYESYPYPERIPADERKRLIVGSPSNIPEVNHFVFGGCRDLTAPFNALVAGGGTGDAAIMLAQNMSDLSIPGKVVHLDMSGPSQAIAKERAEFRGLSNVRFVEGSLLDVAKIAPGPWDYIDCCGVLHHLENPDAGLAVLTEQLAPDGGIGVMVYGEYGRTGIYQMQDMLRNLAPSDEMGDSDRVDTAKRLAKALPPTAWLNRNGLIRDHLEGGDPGVYDLFLHSRDRAYTVPQIADWVAGADMRLVSFIEPFHYDPAWLVRDPRLLKLLEPFDAITRAAFAEQFTGNIKKHVFYAIRKDNDTSPPTTDSPDTIPMLVNHTAKEAAERMPAGGKIVVSTEGLKIDMPVPPLARMIVGLCDGNRTLADIHEAVREKRAEINYAAFLVQFDALYRVMSAINRMVLRLS